MLAFSNIAWPPAAEDEVLSVLSAAKIAGIEVAPTRLWPDWTGSSQAAAATYAQALAAKGFAIPALQAILFGKPELQLLGSDPERDQLSNHLQHVADLAVALGAKSLVFGAPKNRQLGERNLQSALQTAREFFRHVARHYERLGICLCLEANPAQYGCTFITDASAAAQLVRAVDSPGFGLHLDTACMSLAGDDISAAITKNIDILHHFHVSEPFLGRFSEPKIDHAQVAAILRGAKYRGWISLEMRATDSPIQEVQTNDVRQAASFLARTYALES
jgi:D-psicose/D-tagatose/L-ribulose 3-epimerase